MVAVLRRYSAHAASRAVWAHADIRRSRRPSHRLSGVGGFSTSAQRHERPVSREAVGHHRGSVRGRLHPLHSSTEDHGPPPNIPL